uniref:MobE n=1 Tax=Aquipseudomonas alcaligenes TaxID=43263 RepID=Q9XAV8_AQUAC|nr:hypothetical protein [Pseudomonas alcaligenes]AAD40343.1 MobE [Pseudomonas alcaligenes]
MAWQKYVSNHVPDWLHVLPLGLRASVWEILRFVIAGAVFGLLAGLVIGYAKDHTWNGKQKWAQEVQERKAEGQKLLDDVCRDFPNNGACKGR